MKKFFAIYLLSLCMFPILANSTIASCSQTNGRPNCLSHGGCYFTEFEGCQECGSDQYHAKQLNCPANYEDETCTNSCETIPDGYFKTDDGSDIAQCPTTQIETYFDGVANIGNCSCTASTFLIQTNGNEYYCGQCGDGGMQSQSGDIYTCSCQANVGVNNVHGATSSGTRVECACPTGAIWQSGSCKCATNTYLKKNSNNEYVCATCPEHSTSAFGSTSPNDCKCVVNYYMGGTDNTCQSCPEHSSCEHYSGQTYETATCNSGYQKVSDPETQTFTCQSCTNPHTIFDQNVCKCVAGYYGPINGLNTSCTACPDGATTDIGATQRSQCKLTNDTKFCYGTNTNKFCMKLLPSNTVINATNNDSAQNANAE